MNWIVELEGSRRKNLFANQINSLINYAGNDLLEKGRPFEKNWFFFCGGTGDKFGHVSDEQTTKLGMCTFQISLAKLFIPSLVYPQPLSNLKDVPVCVAVKVNNGLFYLGKCRRERNVYKLPVGLECRRPISTRFRVAGCRGRCSPPCRPLPPQIPLDGRARSWRTDLEDSNRFRAIHPMLTLQQIWQLEGAYKKRETNNKLNKDGNSDMCQTLTKFVA